MGGKWEVALHGKSEHKQNGKTSIWEGQHEELLPKQGEESLHMGVESVQYGVLEF